jgi:hypothetical protein
MDEDIIGMIRANEKGWDEIFTDYCRSRVDKWINLKQVDAFGGV